MKLLAIALIVSASVIAGPSRGTASDRVPVKTLASLGLGGLSEISDSRASQVRGKFTQVGHGGYAMIGHGGTYLQPISTTYTIVVDVKK